MFNKIFKTMNFYLSSLNLKKMIVRASIFLLLGLFFCIFPQLSARMLVMVLGGAVLFTGLVAFGSNFTQKDVRVGVMAYFNLALSLAVGIAMLAAPSFFIGFFIILLGLILIGTGLAQIIALASARRWNVRVRFWEYLFGILWMCCGIVICFNPFASTITLFVFFGIGCILYAVSDLVLLLHLRRQIEKVAGTTKDVKFEEVK